MKAQTAIDPIVGAWRLQAFDRANLDDATREPGPLGSDPCGLLVYSESGHMAVSMMSAAADGHNTYMSYSGTWRRDGDDIIHKILVAPDTDWIGTEQSRRVEFSGDRLNLLGRGLTGSRAFYILEWIRLADGGALDRPGR